MVKQHPHKVVTRVARNTVLGLLVGLPVGAACSLSLNLDDQVPCTADSDCTYTNGQGTCSDEGFCVPPGGGADTSDTDPPGDATDNPTTTGVDDSTTTEAPGTSSDSSDSTTTTTGPTFCEMNTDCNEDQRCDTSLAEPACVNLLSPQCDVLEWPEQGRDNVTFIGSIMPTSPPFDELVQPLENAFLLAVEDFNEVATLQGGTRIAWVGCDSTGGADVAEAAAIHLRDAADVDVIVGPVFSESVRQVAENVTVPADIMILSPTASAPSLSNFEDNNLVWRITPNDVFQGNALIDRFTLDLMPSPARLLVLNKDDDYGNEMQQLIAAQLTTGLPGIEIYFDTFEPPENFASQEDMLSSYGEVLGQALAQPGIATMAADYDSPDDHYTHVLIIGTSEAEALVASYFGIWGQLYSMFAPPPMMTVTHGAVPTMEDIVRNIAQSKDKGFAMLAPVVQASLRGTSPNIFDAENFTAFNIRYQIRFNDEEALTSSSLAYDAAMAAMFAMVTVGPDDEITGSAIATGMASLADPAGTPISFGDPVNTFVQDARNTLAAGNTVDLQGVSGALDWDPANGELRADVLGWNVGTPPDDPILNPSCLYLLNPDPAEDGTWFDVSSGAPVPPCN